MSNISKGWKETILQQQSELQKLEALDADLNDANSAIEKFLKKPKSVSLLPARQRLEASNRRKSESENIPSLQGLTMSIGADALDIETDADKHAYAYENIEPYLDVKEVNPNLTAANTVDDNTGSGTPRAPETTIRYQKARINILQKQIDDGQTMRKQMSEQIRELQKQLNTERDENKGLKKRMNTLEIELKKSNAKRAPDQAAAGSSSEDALQQEVMSLKKDIGTAEKIAKQLEAQSKSKDIQLKRATETIAKLTAQVTDLQFQSQRGVKMTDGKLTEAEARIDVLEKQRTEILAAFKKQLKLIDVLKRQKIHVEAARLLSFTEEEFMKTLDWTG